MSNFFSQAWTRLNAQTPTFFKKLRTVGQSLTVAGGACTASNISPSVHMPSTLMHLGINALVAGFIITTVSSFACKDPNEPPTK